VAGYEIDAVNGWIGTFFEGATLICPRQVVNDAVIAHRGALAGAPGVIVVAGTGSMIAAITDDGTVLESGRFQHYAGGARHLVYDVMHRILIGDHTDADLKLIGTVLAWWGARDIGELRGIVLGLGGKDYNDVKRRYGDLAPAITAAVDSSPLADAAVTRLAEKTAVGVRLLAPLISRDAVPVALAGALATSAEFADRITRFLAATSEPTITVASAALDPLGGAALMALESVGVAVTTEVVRRLQVSTGASGRKRDVMRSELSTRPSERFARNGLQNGGWCQGGWLCEYAERATRWRVGVGDRTPSGSGAACGHQPGMGGHLGGRQVLPAETSSGAPARCRPGGGVSRLVAPSGQWRTGRRTVGHRQRTHKQQATRVTATRSCRGSPPIGTTDSGLQVLMLPSVRRSPGCTQH
jgi:glucosamine kinase